MDGRTRAFYSISNYLKYIEYFIGLDSSVVCKWLPVQEIINLINDFVYKIVTEPSVSTHNNSNQVSLIICLLRTPMS